MERELLTKLAVHYIAPYYILPPTSVFISATLRCSSRCFHCGVWRSRRRIQELGPMQWERLLDDPFLKRARTLWLSGGEPTLRRDLAEIVRRAVEVLPGLKALTVASNALHPWRLESFLDETSVYFKERGIYTRIHLSLDGPPEVHDRMRGVEGAYNALERTVVILRRIRESGASLGWGFNCVITKINVKHLAETEELAARLGGEITFNLAWPRGGFYMSDESVGLSSEEKALARPFLERLACQGDPSYRRHYETVLEVLDGGRRRHKCETLEATLYFDPDGSAYPCPSAYEEFKIKTRPGAMVYTWERLARHRRWIRRRLCPTCALGCSFGEGISISEFAKLVMEGVR